MNRVSIGSDNGLAPGRRQAIIWTNAGILLIGPFGINFSEILTEINIFLFQKMHLKMSSAKWRPFCPGGGGGGGGELTNFVLMTVSRDDKKLLKIRDQKCSFDPAGTKVAIFRDDYVNTMGADALDPFIVRPVAVMALIPASRNPNMIIRLTYSDWIKIAAISQTFSDAFSWIRMFEFH